MKVSVIMPAYNAERWIERAIKSVLNQNYTNYELIIIDDGSTDRTWHIIQDYQQNYPDKIIAYKLDRNLGLSFARNKGLDLASGDIVTFLDSDDEFIPYTLQKIVNTFLCLPNDVAIIFFSSRYDTGEISKVGHANNGYLNITDLLCSDIIKGEALVAIKRTYIGKIRFKGKFYKHLSRVYFKIVKNNKGYYVNEVLKIYHNLTNPASLTKVKRKTLTKVKHADEVANEINEFLSLFGEILKKNCPKKYGIALFQLAIHSLIGKEKKRIYSLFNLIKSFYYKPSKATIFWILMALFLPKRSIKLLYLKLYH
ncbi:MAG: glycosyltransferase family 2 protein [Nitrososphaerota archaeon]